MIRCSRALLLYLLTSAGTVFAAPADSIFDQGDHCVAYKALQKQFFIHNKAVIGKTCEVSSQIIPEPGEKYIFEIRVPIHTLRSGDTKRDEDVAQILKSGAQSDIVFRSKAMTAEEWKNLGGKDVIVLKGELSLGQKTFPVSTTAKKISNQDGVEFDGVIKTKLSEFDITPPKMVGGVVVKVKDELELHFHILGVRTLGIESIL